MRMKQFFYFAILLGSLASIVCLGQAPRADGLKVFKGARIIDGTGRAPLDNGVIVVRQGRIEATGSAAEIKIPAGAEEINLTGKTVIPGLINAHGHVGSTDGMRAGAEVYTEQNVLKQLALYARYGVTTIASLGDDGPAGFRLRDAQNQPGLNHARLYVAGPVLAPTSPEDARIKVREVAAMKANFVKIRVDDNLGSTPKMPPEIYRAVLDEAHRLGLPADVHMYYLEDARDLLRSGADFLAHSIRDKPVDESFIALLKSRGVSYCPTLTREVSVYVYESRPKFFDDPFFLKEADPAIMRELENPTRQRAIVANPRAQAIKPALAMAKRNLKALQDAGIPIAMGTDTGPAGRFQGYFEHMELELMAEAGLKPMEILVAATAQPAKTHKLEGVGTLVAGKWADLVVLTRNPLEDIRNTRSIEAVWIAGNRVPAK
ncbi:MAG: amidohydrolase family protein [Opitutus sp.]|nr:amidohydrolase family protein [Opitutus sp.]